MGTLERKDWVQGNKGSLPPSEIIDWSRRASIFKKFSTSSELRLLEKK